ncbi:MAG: hypothetical protein HRT35_34010, partial [Algicola sp.]|nr:hypothetical protein [Algicola sp.]
MFTPEPNTEVDWSLLREKGLAYLQQLSQPLWQNFDLNDPGLTLFETLCYGIEQLQRHSELDIEQLMALSVAGTPVQQADQAMFSPQAILTSQPITALDMRKLLIDIDGVRNAWILPNPEDQATLYLDVDQQRRSLTAQPSSVPLYLKGLHQIVIEPEPDLATEPQTLAEQVRGAFYGARNLAEDISGIEVLQNQFVYLRGKIELAEDADAARILAQLYFNLKQFIEPQVPRYSLAQLLGAGHPIETIYSGPLLENGFILDADLANAEQKQALNLSDLNPLILAIDGVKDMPLLMASHSGAPQPDDLFEWVMPLDMTRALRLAPLADQSIALFKQGQAVVPDLILVAGHLAQITNEAQQARHLAALPGVIDNAVIPSELPPYQGLGTQLPEVYGISELRLPLGATTERKAQAQQLRAFMLIFDQMLANTMAQLTSVHRHFSVTQNQPQTSYCAQVLADSQQHDFSELADLQWLSQIQSDPTADLERRNRLLSHLLARFNETFVDRLLLGQQPQQYLDAKTRYLQMQDSLTQQRGRAIDLLSLTETSGAEAFNRHGLMALLSARLDLSQDEQQA